MNIRHGIAIAALTAVAVPVTLAAPAQAGGDEVIRRGSCTGSTARRHGAAYSPTSPATATGRWTSSSTCAT